MSVWLQRHPRLSVGVLALSLAVCAFVGCTGDYGAVTVSTTPVTSTPDFLATGRTLSHFQAIQVDPRSEDSAGPQFVVADDINGDGLMDLVSAWNESQPVQVHLQRRNGSGAVGFETVTLAGNVPVVSVAGLAVTDFDGDGAKDVAVLVKQSLESTSTCLDSEQPDPAALNGVVLLYLAPALNTEITQPLAWTEVAIETSRLAGTAGDSLSASPEAGGFTAMAVGDMDNDGDMDVVLAWNSACGGTAAGTHTVLVFSNQGYGPVRDSAWTVTVIPDTAPIGTLVKDVALGDVDADGDLDVIGTFPDAGSQNIRWFRNPAIDVLDDYHISDGNWQVGTVGQIATQADVIRITDVDADGAIDVVVRSAAGKLIQWLKGPGMQAITAPLPNLPWRVYTLAEFTERTPEGIAMGDLNFDGKPELVTSAAGGLLWFSSNLAPSLYDQWGEELIVDDEPSGQPSNGPATTDPNVTPTEVAGTTSIHSILVVDLDGDGANDIVATFDRVGLSGVSNDALVWFRNTLSAP